MIIEFPKKKYKIIYADPPWEFKNYSNKWNGKNKDSRWVANHYDILTTQEICDLPVKDITDKSAVLIMWVTYPRLQDAFEVIKCWGFTYKTCAFVWLKRNKKANSRFWGMGYYTRSNSEICLLATKGNPLKRLSRSIHQIVDSKVMKHSTKPDIVRDSIVKLFGDLPRIELFARKRYKGWDVWGIEVYEDMPTVDYKLEDWY